MITHHKTLGLGLAAGMMFLASGICLGVEPANLIAPKVVFK